MKNIFFLMSKNRQILIASDNLTSLMEDFNKRKGTPKEIPVKGAQIREYTLGGFERKLALKKVIQAFEFCPENRKPSTLTDIKMITF